MLANFGLPAVPSNEASMKLTKDLLAGSLFVIIGLGALAMGIQYRLGSATAMGPGYFPVMLSILVAVLGATLFLRALFYPETSEPPAKLYLRPLLIIAVSVLAFGLLIDRAGLIAALAALIFISRLATRGKSLWELALIFVVLTAIAFAIFVFGLKLPLKLGPW
jgi:hypothetical protein